VIIKKQFMEVRKMKKLKANVMGKVMQVKAVLSDKSAENFVDTAIKILIAVVIGALVLAGLYAVFGDIVMPTLTKRITEMFDYAG